MTIPTGTPGYFPVAAVVQWNSRIVFPWLCDPVLNACLFSSSKGPAHEWFRSCNQSCVTLEMYQTWIMGNTHTSVHRITQAYTHIQIRRHVPGPKFTAMHNKQVVMGQDSSEVQRQQNTVTWVIQAAENALITVHSLELQLACYEGPKKGVKQISSEEPSGARTEIYLDWSRACSAVALSLMLKFTYTSTLVVCQMTNDI